MSRIVVTGASGFVGRGIVPALGEAGHDVVAIVRAPPQPGVLLPDVETCMVPDLADPGGLLAEACRGAAMIVHLADNPERTEHGNRSEALARAVAAAATQAGVGRIDFASSIYATLDEQGRASDYGAGKRAAERVLSALYGVDTVSLRLPPVYGPGGKGGFALVAKLAQTGWPLPFGKAHAPRDYLSRTNLARLVVALAAVDDRAFAAAAAQVWEPSDGSGVSTAELARAVGRVTGRPVRLVPVPPGLLAVVAALAAKREGAEAVFAPLATRDDGELQRLVGWRPEADLDTNLGWLRG